MPFICTRTFPHRRWEFHEYTQREFNRTCDRARGYVYMSALTLPVWTPCWYVHIYIYLPGMLGLPGSTKHTIWKSSHLSLKETIDQSIYNAKGIQIPSYINVLFFLISAYFHYLKKKQLQNKNLNNWQLLKINYNNHSWSCMWWVSKCFTYSTKFLESWGTSSKCRLQPPRYTVQLLLLLLFLILISVK